MSDKSNIWRKRCEKNIIKPNQCRELILLQLLREFNNVEAINPKYSCIVTYLFYDDFDEKIVFNSFDYIDLFVV